jgi:hypothetical protein
MPRKLVSYRIVAIFLALLFSISSASASETSPGWIPQGPASEDPAIGIVFSEPTIYPGSVSQLYEIPQSNSETTTINPNYLYSYCDSEEAPKCRDAAYLKYQAFIPKCEQSEDVNCIDSVWALQGDLRVEAKFSKYMPSSPETAFSGNPQVNLPEGKGSSLWELPGIQNSGGSNLVAVSTILSGYRQKSSGVKDFLLEEISTTIDPVSLRSGAYRYPHVREGRLSLPGCIMIGDGCIGAQNGDCAAIDNGSCAAREEFKTETRLGIKLRLLKPPTGWIHGRLKSAQFLVEDNGKFQTWKVEANPVNVPTLSGWAPQEMYEKLNGNPRVTPFTSKIEWSGPLHSGTYAMQRASLWLDYLGDKASAIQDRWSFRSIGEHELSQFEKARTQSGAGFCATGSGLVGVVSTNSMVYQGGPPTWNQNDQTLDYKLTSPHFKPSGSEFLGSYDLKISKRYAQCLYGLNSLPVSATVSIVGDSGESKIAVTTIASDADWIYLSASGFSFSSPTLRVSFVSAAPAKEKVEKTKVLKCEKKKKIITVKGKNAKCPKGYKTLR